MVTRVPSLSPSLLCQGSSCGTELSWGARRCDTGLAGAHVPKEKRL